MEKTRTMEKLMENTWKSHNSSLIFFRLSILSALIHICLHSSTLPRVYTQLYHSPCLYHSLYHSLNHSQHFTTTFTTTLPQARGKKFVSTRIFALIHIFLKRKILLFFIKNLKYQICFFSFHEHLSIIRHLVLSRGRGFAAPRGVGRFESVRFH